MSSKVGRFANTNQSNDVFAGARLMLEFGLLGFGRGTVVPSMERADSIAQQNAHAAVISDAGLPTVDYG
ncbi:MAG TPA: hypothetical protein VMH04_20615 [Candidatus Solibacter sp.]|nr:hypothetical protein [Candidatus Solibacter sp.]